MKTCEEVQELISRLLDGELNEEEQADVAEHLASCPDCRAMHEAFRSLSGAIAEGLEEPPARLHETVMADVRREATYIKAKSSLASSQRGQALELFRQLGADPSTAIGAESKYIVIQDLYDTGRFDAVDGEVYSFSQKAGDQSYWLARAYIVLGDAFAERGQYAQAKATFESIRDGYEPASGADDISDSVRMRLERLSSLMQE